MAMMFGRFEILSELSRSEGSIVFKATDTETNQTVALKTLHLESLGEKSDAFVEGLLAEGESTRALANQNIAVLYGAGEIEDQFCAAMEYVQGNSVATMLSRREGFSIWDLLDITRQVCAGLGYAASQNVVHRSLEPAKVMVQWDGLVKILGYGVSSMSLAGAETGAGLGRLLPYCSPEQIKGDPIDIRSNLFTWGAVLYEMVTDRRAFDAEDTTALISQIENEMPPAPSSVNPKINPLVSALIMKAIAKDPSERYQSATELAEDLEKCKEGGSKTVTTVKKPAPLAKPVVSAAARAAAASKFVATAPKSEDSGNDEFVAPASIPAPPPRKEPAASSAPMKAAAATASVGSSSFDPMMADAPASPAMETPALETFEPSHSPVLSAATVEPETETFSKMASVDPVMAEPPATGQSTRSFSDIDELPPLKEPVSVHIPEPTAVAPEVAEPSPLAQLRSKKEEKPKVQPREVAEKAIKEIKSIPPKLIMFSILGALGLILIIAISLFFHVRSQDEDTTAAPRPVAVQKTEAPAPAPAETAPETVAVPESEPVPEVTVRQIAPRAPAANKKKNAAPAVEAVVPGQLQIDSSPSGAQIQLDGKTDASWVTPFALTGINPGQHTLSVSKNGFSTDTRTLDITAGSKAFVTIHLAAVNALVVVNSTPAGATILIDGKETGKVTPAQFAVEKGSHKIALRKQGFLEESTTVDLGSGQNFQFAPALRALGNVDDIRTVGKFKKLFGGSGDSTAGMGTVSIRTQPKGAQTAVNGRILDKTSPVDFMASPGTYELDITLTGFKRLHKVVTIEKGGKVAVEEVLERE